MLLTCVILRRVLFLVIVFLLNIIGILTEDKETLLDILICFFKRVNPIKTFKGLEMEPQRNKRPPYVIVFCRGAD